MSSLRARLGKKIEPTVEIVEHEGEGPPDADGNPTTIIDTYTLCGLPSANVVLASIDETENEKLAVLYSATMKPCKFTAEDLRSIRIVHAYCETPEGEDPYQISEIAKIFATDGTLFLKLLGAASKILSNKHVSLGEVELKNSQGAVTLTLSSSDSVLVEPASIPTP